MRLDPETMVDRWLEDGPTRLADASRRRMLAEILATRQPPATLRVPPPGFLQGVLAAAIVVALMTSVGVALNSPRTPPGATSPPSPSPSASPAAQSPGLIEVSSFQPPFEYDPSLLGGELGELARAVRTFHSHGSGVTMWSSPSGLRDPCVNRGIVAVRDADDVADHIRKSDVVEVVTERQATLDRYPALEVRIRVRPDPPCETLNLLADPASTETLNLDSSLETVLRIADVGGETVVVERWSDDLDSWIARTRAFMGSIRFLDEGG